jgi:tetratricopeptide (TPR) repeat protein
LKTEVSQLRIVSLKDRTLSILVAALITAVPQPAWCASAADSTHTQLIDRVSFVDVYEAPHHLRKKLGVWQPSEIATVKSTLLKVEELHPKLFTGAMNVSTLRFYRSHEEDCLASTHNEGIAISDQFFVDTFPHQYITLLHELAHWCDGDQITLSRTWVRLAQTNVAHAKAVHAIFGGENDQKYGGPSGVWYSRNLCEALAQTYCAAAFHTDLQQPLSEPERYVLNEIENISPERCRYLSLENEANSQINEGNFKTAIDLLLKARAAGDDYVTTYLSLAEAYDKLGNEEQARGEVAKAERTLRESGVASHDRSSELCQMILNPRGSIDTVIAAVSVLEKSKRNVLPLMLSVVLSDNLSSPLLTDVARLVLHSDYVSENKLASLRKSDCDNEFITEQMDAYIASTNARLPAHRLRGRFLESIGQYDKALHDYRTVLEIPDAKLSDHVNLVVCLARLGQVAEAKKLEDELERTYPSADELMVARVAIYEAQGQRAMARFQLSHYLEGVKRNEPEHFGDFVEPPENVG